LPTDDLTTRQPPAGVRCLSAGGWDGPSRQAPAWPPTTDPLHAAQYVTSRSVVRSPWTVSGSADAASD